MGAGAKAAPPKSRIATVEHGASPSAGSCHAEPRALVASGAVIVCSGVTIGENTRRNAHGVTRNLAANVVTAAIRMT
jgi:hypothetical protein